MGIYDKLEKIRQGSPAPNVSVGSPNATKTVETLEKVASPISQVNSPGSENQEAITSVEISLPSSEEKVETTPTPSTPVKKQESKDVRMKESKNVRFLTYLH